MKYFKYLIAGLFFGLLLYKAEVISWFRIQEMFRFQAFHMYGVIGSAVIVGVISVFLIKRLKFKTFSGEEIKFPTQKFSWGLIVGGGMFGIGWALTGACPGPLYTLVGAGYFEISVALLSAIAGVWLYGLLRKHLPS